MWKPRGLVYLGRDYRALGNLRLQYRIARRTVKTPLFWLAGCGMLGYEEYQRRKIGRDLEARTFINRKQHNVEAVIGSTTEQYYPDVRETPPVSSDQEGFIVVDPPDPVTDAHRRRVLTNLNAAVAFATEHKVDVRWICDSPDRGAYSFTGGVLPCHRPHIALENAQLLAASPADFGFTLKHELGHQYQRPLHLACAVVGCLGPFLIAMSLRLTAGVPFICLYAYALRPAGQHLWSCVAERHADWYARRRSTVEELRAARLQFKAAIGRPLAEWDTHPSDAARVAAIERELVRRGAAFTGQSGSEPPNAGDPKDS